MADEDTLLKNLIADMEDRARLENLTDFELIRETIKSDIADDNRVLELMARIYPRWFDEPEPPAMPERPRFVSFAVPLDVAHDLVAFSECHCEESVARGEEETNGAAYKPCLWCACQAALYRATKLAMYKPEGETSLPNPPETS